MEVTIVHVQVKPEHVEEFIAASAQNHLASVQEAGNMRFDILQDVNDPCRFILYEAYRDKSSAAAHKTTDHYLAWRERVVNWMAQPRQGITYTGLYPKS